LVAEVDPSNTENTIVSGWALLGRRRKQHGSAPSRLYYSSVNGLVLLRLGLLCKALLLAKLKVIWKWQGPLQTVDTLQGFPVAPNVSTTYLRSNASSLLYANAYFISMITFECEIECLMVAFECEWLVLHRWGNMNSQMFGIRRRMRNE